MKLFRTISFAITGLFLLMGCQKDDICPPGTPTTPRLLIDFYDAEDPSRLRAVPNLEVRVVGEERTLLGPTTANAIQIPLRTDSNSTEFIFIRNSGTASANEDRITITYTPDPEYINRACGYRMNFRDLNINVHADQNNWILSDLVLQENVENETETHISFTH